jgi:heat shock protein HslJ
MKTIAIFTALMLLGAGCTPQSQQPTQNPPVAVVPQPVTITDGKLVGYEWKWVNTSMNDDSVTKPKKAGTFTLTIGKDGNVSGKTDCNGYFGTLAVNNGSLAWGPIGATKMYCEGSQETIFHKHLAETQSYFIDKDGNLILEIKYDSGSMKFEK